MEQGPGVPQDIPLESLLKDKEAILRLLEGSCVTGESDTAAEAWEAWENGRRFIAEAIHRPGTFLDFGCANGLLLKSLQYWSTHELSPYGIDINETALDEAKNIFPEKTDHFLTPQAFLEHEDRPRQFDFIYWNVWNNHQFDTSKQPSYLERFMEMTAPGGRTILGFYDAREKNESKIAALAAAFAKPTAVKENPHGEEMLAWYER